MKKFTFLLALLCAAASSQAQVDYPDCRYQGRAIYLDATGIAQNRIIVDSFEQTATAIPAQTISYSFLQGGGTSINSYNCQNNLAIIALGSSGDSDTCYTDIGYVVSDTFAPTARCQNISVTLNATTQSVTVAAIDLDNGSTDNCNLNYDIVDGNGSRLTKTYTVAGVYNETLRVVDLRGTFRTCAATVTVLAPVGVTVYESGQTVRIMPNPFDGVVRVELTTAMAENQPIQLYSLDGRLVQQAEIPAGANIFELNTTELPTGVYLLQLRNSAFQLSERIIKQ